MKTYYKLLSVAAILSMSASVLLMCSNAKAFVSPSCDDRELLRLKITASTSNLANPNGNRKIIAVRSRNGRCEMRNLDVLKLDLNEEMKALINSREKLNKLKASRSKNEYKKIDIDVN